MSKQIETLIKEYDLYTLKMAVACYHSGEYNRINKARDACYTSNNSIEYKHGLMLDVKADMASLRQQLLDDEATEGKGTIVGVKLSKKLDIFKSMEEELAELQDTHKNDRAVYKKLTGETWNPPRKSGSSTSASQSELEQIDKILAKSA